jgi:two-component system cell cycle response regulator
MNSLKSLPIFENSQMGFSNRNSLENASIPQTEARLLTLMQAQIERLQGEVSKWKTRAERDALTGCLRRESFREIIDQRLRSGWMPEKISLAVLDLDHFKTVNDTHGHHAGDQVLAQVGEKLRNFLPQGSLVARTGGEEFVILLPMPTTIAGEILNRLRAEIALTEIVIEDGKSLQVTASIGLAEWQTSTPMLMATIEADKAVYKAKKGGRNQVVKI